jgi:hypothetical protein
LVKKRSEIRVNKKIDRNNIEKFFRKININDMYKPLRIEFENEIGYDMGGLRREFYQVIGDYLKKPEAKLFNLLENKLYTVSNESEEHIFYKIGAFFANSILYLEQLGILISRNLFNYLMGLDCTLFDLKDEYPHLYNSFLGLCQSRLENRDAVSSLNLYFTQNDN